MARGRGLVNLIPGECVVERRKPGADMKYIDFLKKLSNNKWMVNNMMFAYLVHDCWQTSFIRIGGRKQFPGVVSFVICVRFCGVKRIIENKKLLSESLFDHYQFRMTLGDIESGNFQYKNSFNRTDLEFMAMNGDWRRVIIALEKLHKDFTSSLTPKGLIAEILKRGQAKYEWDKTWLKDLRSFCR